MHHRNCSGSYPQLRAFCSQLIVDGPWPYPPPRACGVRTCPSRLAPPPPSLRALRSGAVPQVSLAVLRRELMDPIMNKLTPQDFLDAVAVRQQLVNGNYFGEEGCPAVLKQFWDDDLVMNTVGGCLFYLQRSAR